MQALPGRGRQATASNIEGASNGFAFDPNTPDTVKAVSGSFLVRYVCNELQSSAILILGTEEKRRRQEALFKMFLWCPHVSILVFENECATMCFGMLAFQACKQNLLHTIIGACLGIVCCDKEHKLMRDGAPWAIRECVACARCFGEPSPHTWQSSTDTGAHDQGRVMWR